MITNPHNVIALFIAFAVSAAIAPFLIPVLRRMKIGQTERTEGLESHLQKAGTPTMGGLIILAGVIVSSAFFIGKYPRIVPIIFLTIGFGIIGFIDDYLKVVLRRSDGLLPKQKMLGQIIVTTVFVVYLWMKDPACLELIIPFTHGYALTGQVVRIIATPLVYFAVIGTVNGVNFTDGVDGLASSVTAVVAAFFIYVSEMSGANIGPAAAAVLGALLAFLLFNCYKAQIFMGDTGSLALGGFVAGCAYMMRMPIFIIIFGLVYLVEVISVMIQVTYFKKTGGKRFFRMAPIHHHFEKGGWSETKVVTVFTIVTILLCIIAAVAL